MDIIITVVIGILGLVFVVAAIGLMVLIVRYKCKKTDLISEQHRESRPETQLIVDSSDVSGIQSPLDVELGAVRLSNPKLEELLDNEQWLEDAFGLVPHCLSILKICHHLTERLVHIGCSYHRHSPEKLVQMVGVARQISPKVDEVLESFESPLNPRLLEARFTAMVLCVSQLVMVTKNICSMSGKVDWIDQSLHDVEDHLRVLHEARHVMEGHDQTMSENSVHTAVVQAQPYEPSTLDKNDISQL